MKKKESFKKVNLTTHLCCDEINAFSSKNQFIGWTGNFRAYFLNHFRNTICHLTLSEVDIMFNAINSKGNIINLKKKNMDNGRTAGNYWNVASHYGKSIKINEMVQFYKTVWLSARVVERCNAFFDINIISNWHIHTYHNSTPLYNFPLNNFNKCIKIANQEPKKKIIIKITLDTREITQCQLLIHLQTESTVKCNGKIHQKSSHFYIWHATNGNGNGNWNKKCSREKVCVCVCVNKMQPIYHLTVVKSTRARQFIHIHTIIDTN